MAYSKLGIANLALGRLGIKKITDYTSTQQGIRVADVWEYVRDIVNGALDWKFATVRVELEQRYEIPAYEYDYAYALPTDFLRLARPTKAGPVVYPNLYEDESVYPWKVHNIPLPDGLEKVTNGVFTGAATGWTLGTGWAYSSNTVVHASGVATLAQLYSSMISAPVVDELYRLSVNVSAIAGGSLIPAVGGASGPPISTAGVKYIDLVALSATTGIVFTPSATGMTCTLDDISCVKLLDRMALVTDYDNSDYEIYCTYVKRVIDPTFYPIEFIECLAWRLAAELATERTESKEKFKWAMDRYAESLMAAKSANQAHDSLTDETGNTDWEDAGR